jgi:hypothetical protein
MRLLMENIKPVGEPGATGSIFTFIFRKGWPDIIKKIYRNIEISYLN